MPKYPSSHTIKILTGLLVIYLVWGSTYLAIQVAVKTMPPFLMASSRFLTGGLIAAAVIWMFRGFHLTKRQWFDNSIVAAFMLLGGNGLVSWAEKSIPSGVATLIVSLNPLFFVMAEWVVSLWRKEGIAEARPHRLTFAGLGLGTLGLVILVGPTNSTGEAASLEALPVVALVMACLCWTIGSLYNRYSKDAAEPFAGSAAQMLCGGVWLLLASFLLGETRDFSFNQIAIESVYAWLYLVFAGSLLAFPVFTWLMKNGSPTVVSTYAYINPIVAVFLGWLLANEKIDSRVLIASVSIVLGVAMITISKQVRKQAAQSS